MTLIGQKEVTAQYGISRSSLYSMEREGKISPHRTTGGHRRYDGEEIARVMAPKQEPTATTNKKSAAEHLDDHFLQMIQNSGYLTRSGLASKLGKQFNGERDLYSSFGYIIQPSYLDYRALFDRTGIATRAVEILPNDTWRKPPAIIDGDERSDGTTIESPFLKEFNKLADRLKLWPMLRQADILCGIGHYSVILMGAPGKMGAPAENKNLADLSAFDEQQAHIQQWVMNDNDPRYGLPQTYSISFNMYDSAGLAPMPLPESMMNVDASRVIHITENCLGSRVYGRPRLQNLINRLFDLEKVTGGSAEAVWLTIFKGFVLSSKEGAEMPASGSPEADDLKQQMTDFVNRLQRYMVLDQADIKDLGVDTINVSDTYEVLTTDLIGSLPGVPKRIFFGAESGHLASTQDFQEYMGTIASRQTNFAEPEILRPFINWCISHEVIPGPKSGEFKVWWPDLYEMTMTEKAHVSLEVGDGAFRATNGAPENVIAPDEWRSIINLPPMKDSVDKAIPGSEVVPTPTGTVGNRPGKDVTGATEGGK